MIVTCHTPGCLNADVSIDLTFSDPGTGEVIVPDAYVCGVCGQPITDVTDAAPSDADGPQDA